MRCPNGCDVTPYSCPIHVDADTYAEKQAANLADFDGVQAAISETTSDGNPRISLQIAQDEYATENHFKNRRSFENMGHCTLTDTDDGVILEFTNAQQVITAMECRDCDTVYDPTLDNRVFTNPQRYSTF